METNNFTEFLAVKKPTASTVFARALIIVGWTFLVIASLFLILMNEKTRMFIAVLPVIWVLAGLLCWYLWGLTNVEYEYTVVQGYFQLDKIINRKRRKSVCEAKISELSACAPVSAKNEALRNKNKFRRVINAASSMKSDILFYMTYRDAQSGETLIYFDADKEAISCIAYYNRSVVDKGDDRWK